MVKQIKEVENKLQKWLQENPIQNKWGVIYGSLPPEIKKAQAIAFNNRDEGFQYLIATDAIGMGLNLNIRRVIFSNIQKMSRGEKIPLTPSQILQISGRAGRYKEDGFVSAFTFESLNTIRKVVERDKMYAPENTSDYKDIIKKSGQAEETQKDVEINIDSIQAQESDEEQSQDFVAVADVDVKESDYDDSEINNSDDSEFVVDHKFSKQQKFIK